jgi:hypothetical protein
MNVLVFDASASVAHLATSVLRGLGHRAAAAQDADDARRKLDTALFDSLVFGPGGAPDELVLFLESEFPRMPVVLAGMPAAAEPAGQVVEVLPAPLETRRLAAAFRRLERRRRDRVSSLPAQLASDAGLSIVCRLAEMTPDTMVLCGESDEFHRYFEASPARAQALVAGLLLAGDVASNETDVARVTRRVSLRLPEGAARPVLAGLLK